MRKGYFWEVLLIGGVVLMGVFFRFYDLETAPPGLYPDEAMNGNNALEALRNADFKAFYPENNGREGLFINLQALSLWFFGNEPWALRLVSAIFGTLTIVGIYLLAGELFRGFRFVALLSSFFLAASFWHVNFSRIGFRAIAVPFFAVFGMYFLLKGLRSGKIHSLAAAGIFTGLGFHTYIAFRFMPFVFAVPLAREFYYWLKRGEIASFAGTKTKCAPCAIALFLFITFVAALPIGIYFFENPQYFFGRAADVSVFSAPSPAFELLKSSVLTLQMFFYRGDCNPRHNFNCKPELYPLVAIFFIIGFAAAIREFFKKEPNFRTESAILLAWLLFMSLPAVLTREGVPHALRSIGMIPPAMILAGLGAHLGAKKIIDYLEKGKEKWPQRVRRLARLKREFILLFVLLISAIPVAAYRDYFIRWADSPKTYFAFSADIRRLGEFFEGLPDGFKKYAVVNLAGVDVRGIPAPAQTVMFATDTFGEAERKKKNIFYLLPHELDGVPPAAAGQKIFIAFLNGEDRETLRRAKELFPGAKIRAVSDFIVLETEPK